MKRNRSLSRKLGIAERDMGPHAVDSGRVLATVQDRIGVPDPERKIVMLKSKKKLLIIAAVVVLALSVTAFAAGSGLVTTWYGVSRGVDYQTLPTAEKCVRDAGYAPVLLETFENGYTYDSGYLITNRMDDENGGTLETFKSFTFDYEKDGDQVMLDQERYNAALQPAGEAVATVDGVELRYFTYQNRLVPPDYEPTEEELALAEGGDIVLSYGADAPDDAVVQMVSWQMGDMHYSLTQIDGALTREALIAMAAEVIRAA